MLILAASRSVTLSAAIAGLVSCSAGVAPYGPATYSVKAANGVKASSGSTYKVTKGLLFVAVSAAKRPPYNDIQVYDVRKAHPVPIAEITDGVNRPCSVCIDKHRTLYVVNLEGSVSEYALGATTPKLVITNGIDQPAFCAIDGGGNLWVTNIGGRNATEYLVGSSVPHKVITKGLFFPIGIAFDHHGVMYIANQYGGSETNVQVFSPGETSPSRTITTGVEKPVGINVDASGTLYVTNLVPGNIAEYHPGSSKPFHTITQQMNGPAAITFAPSGWMYVSNYGFQGGGSGPPSVILEFRPHSELPSKKMITNGLYLPLGTAFYPPASL